ncbi:hypothetical protein [Halomonas ramblicola]|uniref:hypothetical protein n=1 Tax=Halomonas ramblicola TaxID=747349 RepID=UPI0025B281B6|nr:hypothetical protein [Halomonas ramblicola]MDN3523524.1 hypothetical protein [Halomonas ramblicola]
MAKLRLFPSRNPSARAAAHRAMARAALFSDSSASTRLRRYNHHINKARAFEEQAGLPVFEVYLARSGARLEIRASSWGEALRRTGRHDACIVERLGDRHFEATFKPDAPVSIDVRLHYGTDADALRGTLANVAHQVARASEQGGEA